MVVKFSALPGKLGRQAQRNQVFPLFSPLLDRKSLSEPGGSRGPHFQDNLLVKQYLHDQPKYVDDYNST
jgi:hypothetical protein